MTTSNCVVTVNEDAVNEDGEADPYFTIDNLFTGMLKYNGDKVVFSVSGFNIPATTE